MKNKECRLILFILLFLLSRGASSAEKFAFKLSGGMSYLFVGDINQGIQGYFDRSKQIPWMTWTIRGDAKPVHLGFNFEGDILIHLTPKIWIGLGAGYIRAGNTSEISAENPEGYQIKASHKASISAIPVKLGISYVFFKNEAMKLVFNAGTSLYFADYKYDKQPIATGEPPCHQTAGAQGFGFQGGVGWELKLARNIAFFLDGQARYAKMGGFKGTITIEYLGYPAYVEKGTLYFWEETVYGDHQPYFVGKYPQVYIRQNKPSGPDITNVREAKIDFSGFSFMCGIKFYF